MRNLEDMSILVTGGGSGIGADCARRFCSQGARVTISGRRLEKLEAVKDELGERCRVVQGDVTAQADREAMAANLIAGYGAIPLVGTAEQIVDGMLAFSNAGLDGITLSWVNYEEGLTQFRDTLLPMMQQAGLRE